MRLPRTGTGTPLSVRHKRAHDGRGKLGGTARGVSAAHCCRSSYSDAALCRAAHRVYADGHCRLCSISQRNSNFSFGSALAVGAFGSPAAWLNVS